MTTYPMRARIRNEGSGPARVDIYDDIGAGGWFSEGYTPASFADAIKGVSGPLDVHINSGGGDVSDGIAIASAIRAYPGRKRTVVDGMAASIASVIAQAGDERIVEPGAMLMIHDPLTACMGNQADFLKVAETLGKHGDNLAQQYADRAGTKSAAEWRDVMRQEAWYTADEAVAAGLADRVGTAEARLPQGVDIEMLAAHAPARIMAALRALPKAAAGDSCKTCGGSGRLKHPGSGKNGMKCPGCGGTGVYTPGDDDDGGGQGDDEGMELGAQDRLRSAAAKPYEPQPYHRDPDENVECPVCHLFDDTDAKFCDQCGGKLEGRDDVRVIPAAAAAASGTRVRGASAPEQLGKGWVRDPDGKVRFDPDGDGDDDSTPEGDTDHDYFDPDGREIKPVPPCPVPRDSLDGQLWAFYRHAVKDAGGKVDNSPWDSSKAWAAGAASDDPAKFYAGICAGEKAGDKSTQAAWALPYRYAPGDPPNAAGVRAGLAALGGARGGVEGLTNEAEATRTLQAAMKVVNPDWEPEDSAANAFGADALERYRAALKGAQ